MLWDMHLCVFDVRLSFENRVVTKLAVYFDENWISNFLWVWLGWYLD